MTAQEEYSDILFLYEKFKPTRINYVDSIRDIKKNIPVIDKFKNINDRYKDDVFNQIFKDVLSDVNKKEQEVKTTYCGNGKNCKAHCNNCCVIECINKYLLKEIADVDMYKSSYQALLNTINKTIKHICDVHKNTDERTQEHLTACIDILQLYKHEMLCLQQLLETYNPQPQNNNILLYPTIPMTPDIVSIPFKASPEYGSTEEFWEELQAISQKRLEEECPQNSIDKQVVKGEAISTIKITFDFSEQWKKYPEQMKKWAETPKTIPELIKKYALEFPNKKPQQPLSNNTVQQNEVKNYKIFISYSYDDEQHEQWVENFATKIKENGIDVIFDKWHTKLGQPLTNFMEQSVSNAQRVICILTPNYKKKADKLDGGVGYEYSIVSSEILRQTCTTKFIPLLKSGNGDDAIPISLYGRKYLDMKNGEDFDKKLNELLKDLTS